MRLSILFSFELAFMFLIVEFQPLHCNLMILGSKVYMIQFHLRKFIMKYLKLR